MTLGKASTGAITIFVEIKTKTNKEAVEKLWQNNHGHSIVSEISC